MKRTSKDIRNESRFVVLRSIYARGTVARSDIAQETGLSLATVNTLVNELLEEGVLVEAGRLSSGGGRPTITFQINAERGWILAVDVAETYLSLVLYDLALASHDALRVELDLDPHTIENLCRELARASADLLQRNGLTADDVLSAGVSLPGQVDPVRGMSVFAPNWNWHEVPVVDALVEALGVPVRVDNPLMAVATAELWFGAGRTHRDVVTVNLGTGVGAGIAINGQLVRGQGNSAGEWGHTTLVFEGRECPCGRRGCVESYVGVRGLRRTLEEIAPDHPALSRTGQRDFIRAVTSAVAVGDEAAISMIDRTGDYLTAALGNLVNLLNPEHIAVAGWVSEYTGSDLIEHIREHIGEEALPGPARTVTIGVSEIGRSAPMGIAIIALESFLARLGLPSASSTTPVRPAPLRSAV